MLTVGISLHPMGLNAELDQEEIAGRVSLR